LRVEVGWAKRSVPTIAPTPHADLWSKNKVGTAQSAFAHPTFSSS
jgi:hypothetical protein